MTPKSRKEEALQAHQAQIAHTGPYLLATCLQGPPVEP